LFWLSLVQAVLLICPDRVHLVWLQLPAEYIGSVETKLINAVFGLLVLLGIVVDPTVDGLHDSQQAMRYLISKKEVNNDCIIANPH